jgi:TRAP-type C4-dicarboxylate transport system permease small subunit
MATPSESTPRINKRRHASTSLASIAAISFSLTFVVAGVLLLLDMLPPTVAALDAPIDLGVLLLMVPLCALIFTLLAEALRAAVRGLPRPPGPKVAPLTDWRPERSEI